MNKILSLVSTFNTRRQGRRKNNCPADRKAVNVGCNCKVRHTYTYKQPGDNWFWLTAAILNIVFTVWIVSRIVQADPINYVAFLLPIIFGLLGIVFLRVFLLRRQYHEVDQDKVVTVDTLSKEVVINQAGKETIIIQSDIEKVEIFSSWNTNPLFSNMGYVKFNLLNGDNVTVTRLTADDADLQPIITGKPVDRKTRLMNPIS